MYRDFLENFSKVQKRKDFDDPPWLWCAGQVFKEKKKKKKNRRVFGIIGGKKKKYVEADTSDRRKRIMAFDEHLEEAAPVKRE